jgi:hypothetical protein
MIDEALPTMIDEVLICFRNISGSAVEPRRVWGHLICARHYGALAFARESGMT